MYYRSILPLGAFLFFFHSTLSIVISFLPLYFQSQGFTGVEIGWIMAISPLATTLAQPFWGYLSDKYKTIKKLLLFCIIAMLLSSLFIFQMKVFFALLFAMFIFSIFMSPIGALGDSLAQKTATQYGINFGSIRMWGSVGFATSALVVGQIIFVLGIDNITYLLLFYGTITFLFGLRLTDAKVSKKAVNIIDAVKAIKSPPFYLFLLVILLISTAHRTNDYYLGIYIMELGGSEALVGWAWFVGVLTEALVFATAFFWFRRYHELTFITIAAFFYGLRWFFFSQVNDPLQIVFLQGMHGITFAAFYLTAFQLVSKLVPKELLSTGHLLFLSIFFGLSGILGALLGGSIIDTYGGNTLYYFLSYLSFTGMISVIIYRYFFKAKV